MRPWDQAHPRSRGENTAQKHFRRLKHGSSPLTRGKLLPITLCGMVSRLIPAHAGKTERGGARSHRAAAHPRSRGENLPLEATGKTEAGSSPLTRGKPGPRRTPRQRHRLIPAHAGKTLTSSTRSLCSRAHPRSRGENRDGVLRSMSIGGSSPLTRGKLVREATPENGGRLIPAHAGKTRFRPRNARDRRAHPRSRGENPSADCTEPNADGSSPLTRGKRPAACAGHDPRGLIPAHAGKTRGARHPRVPAAAHPRSRGENAS